MIEILDKYTEMMCVSINHLLLFNEHSITVKRRDGFCCISCSLEYCDDLQHKIKIDSSEISLCKNCIKYINKHSRERFIKLEVKRMPIIAELQIIDDIQRVIYARVFALLHE
jgi:hypothetical protein